jgi:hypothetical protein
VANGKPLPVTDIVLSRQPEKDPYHISKQQIFDHVCYLCNIWGRKGYAIAFKYMPNTLL